MHQLLFRYLFRVNFALVKEITNSKVKLLVEEMDVKQARLFSLLNLVEFIDK